MSSRGQSERTAHPRTSKNGKALGRPTKAKTTGPKAADVAKSTRYEAKIAKMEADLAATRAEYAAHQAATGARLTAEQQAAARAGGQTGQAKAAPAPRAPLVPVGRMEPGERLVIDPFAPPNPAFLTRVYGHSQLGQALEPYSLEHLKRAADTIQSAHPGTKPSNWSRKQSIIDYIVKYS